MSLADPLLSVLAVALLSAVPLVALLTVRRGQPEHPPRLSFGRFFLVYAVAFAALLLAARIDDLPASLAVLGVLLGLLGLGIGLEGLYRFLYGAAWLNAHPGVARRDAGRWQRITLLGAALCLIAAVLLALRMTDVAYAP